MKGGWPAPRPNYQGAARGKGKQPEALERIKAPAATPPRQASWHLALGTTLHTIIPTRTQHLDGSALGPEWEKPGKEGGRERGSHQEHPHHFLRIYIYKVL